MIYAYVDEYKEQGVREGLNPDSIVVVGNPIVDILNYYYFSRKDRYDTLADDQFFASRGIRKSEYYFMTCHRRENLSEESLRAILSLVAESPRSEYTFQPVNIAPKEKSLLSDCKSLQNPDYERSDRI